MTRSPALDVETSARIASKIRRKVKRCWQNAAQALELLPPGALYVEGWIGGEHCLEHGWCEVDGKIIDPTLFDDLDQPYQYYPGFRFTKQETAKAIRAARGQLPIASTMPKGGLTDPCYLEAFRSAQLETDMHLASDEDRAAVGLDKKNNAV